MRSGSRATARPRAPRARRPPGSAPGPPARRARPAPARGLLPPAASLVQLVAEDGQTDGLEAEAEAVVELERGVVVELRVDNRSVHAVSPHPVERIEGEGATEAAPLVGGVDREPLEVTVPLRSAADRVRAQSRVPGA